MLIEPVPAIRNRRLNKGIAKKNKAKKRLPVEHVIATVKDGLMTELRVNNEPGGGVMGTIKWLGVPVPAMA